MNNSTEIYIGADHNGFDLKNKLVKFLSLRGYTVHDIGPKELNPTDDFPEIAEAVSLAMLGSSAREPRGILLCGSGQGVCIAANRFKGVRATLGYDKESVRSSRNDDDSNILCLPARELSLASTESLVITWLETAFAGATRYKRRIKKLDNLG